jgi:hypothetical protein
VNGNVKSNYNAHEELFLLVGEMYMMEQVMEVLNMQALHDRPTHALIPEDIHSLTAKQKLQVAMQLLRYILKYYNYGKFKEQMSTINPPSGPMRVVGRVCGYADGSKLMQFRRVKVEVDETMSYASNLCQWALHLMHMNDTNKEADLDRLILSCKMNILFFYSHSTRSKYFIENLDFLIKTVITGSPRTQLRLLEGSFGNVKGGAGNNAEIDLVMEWHIRNTKDDIRRLGGNKTEKAIVRATLASDKLTNINQHFHSIVLARNKSSRHSNKVSLVDREKTNITMRTPRPFRFQSARKFRTQKYVPESPFHNVQFSSMEVDMRRVIFRLTNCLRQDVDPEDVEEEIVSIDEQIVL